MNTLTTNYQDRSESDLAMLSLLSFDLTKNFRIQGGAFYSTVPGFSPTIGVGYLTAGRVWFFTIAPGIDIGSVPSYSSIAILRYRPQITENTKLYTSLKILSIFDVHGHIKSYQWTRLGIEKNGFQFGVSANFDEFGPRPDMEFSAGIFVRREIF